MFLFLYSTLLTAGLVVASPWWLWRMFTTDRYREGLAQRLGLISPTLKAAVREAHAQGRRTIWLHAVSVGEALASVRLVEELQTALPNHLILISTTTATGQKVAPRSASAKPTSSTSRSTSPPPSAATLTSSSPTSSSSWSPNSGPASSPSATAATSP